MHEGNFDARTLFCMNVALDRVCEHTPLGEQHEVRERVAQGIIRSAKSRQDHARSNQNNPREAAVRALDRRRFADAKQFDCSTASLEISAGSRTSVAPISIIFLRDDFGHGVVAINQAKRVRGLSVGRVQALDFFRS
jgi:hypothetical protein